MSEVLADGLLGWGEFQFPPFAMVEGFSDLSPLVISPKDGVEVVEACFEDGIVEGEVGDDSGLGVGCEQSRILESDSLCELVSF